MRTNSIHPHRLRRLTLRAAVGAVALTLLALATPMQAHAIDWVYVDSSVDSGVKSSVRAVTYGGSSMAQSSSTRTTVRTLTSANAEYAKTTSAPGKIVTLGHGRVSSGLSQCWWKGIVTDAGTQPMKCVQFYDYSSRAAGNTTADPQQAEPTNDVAQTGEVTSSELVWERDGIEAWSETRDDGTTCLSVTAHTSIDTFKSVTCRPHEEFQSHGVGFEMTYLGESFEAYLLPDGIEGVAGGGQELAAPNLLIQTGTERSSFNAADDSFVLETVAGRS